MKRIFYLIAIFSCVFSGCKDENKTIKIEEKTDKFCLNNQLKKSTTIVDIQQQPIFEQLSLPGKIEYNENDLVEYKSLLSGTVDRVNFELGDYVQKGQVLAVIKSNEVLQLTQEKRFQQSQIDLFQKQIKTKNDLLNDGFATQAEVTEIEHQLQAAKIEVEKINSTLAMFRSIGNGQFQILAPKNGYIVQKSISIGQTITTDIENALFSISNLKQVWVMINIYANQLQYIHQGNDVKVKTLAFPDRIYTGKIDKIYNVFDDNEHVLKARVVLNNPDLKLMPGLSADIIIDKKNNLGNAFAIPNNAIVFNNNKEYIVVYKNDCELEIRKITSKAKNETFTFVEEQFKPNEKVVANNALIIYEELNK
jgi:membrane fusion protein, heavy metal efflux system